MSSLFQSNNEIESSNSAGIDRDTQKQKVKKAILLEQTHLVLTIIHEENRAFIIMPIVFSDEQTGVQKKN